MTKFSFTLSDKFVAEYADKKVPWGYADAAGNAIGEITFLRTYSRLKPDGTKERWHEVCERVINGMYSIQKDYAKANRLPWNENKAQASAKEAYSRLFDLKWSPPGRGLWVMGTPIVNDEHNSAPLQNCAFVSTADMTKANPSWPFRFLMEASMLGVGVGFDTKGAEKDFILHEPSVLRRVEVIPDTREGWVESVGNLIDSYLKPNQESVEFDYSKIRPAGEPIKTFGGTASGPGPLRLLHERLRMVLGGRDGEPLTTKDIADIGNLIGTCVVAGNVRRSAELLLGDINDEDFLNLKNPEVFPTRNSYDPESPGWGWMSNNSVSVSVGDDLSGIVDGIVRNGEPGVIWLDVSRQYGRLADPPNNKDWRVTGYNPCAEQSLESGEMCTLVETFIGRHEYEEDFLRTLKFAYLYAKTVTLLPTHWPETNAIMQRNRRIGTSVSGMSDFADNHGLIKLRKWLDNGYETIKHYDNLYSEWLCVRESIKMTTVKPSGTVSLLAGVSPGVHWAPGGAYFNRAIRFRKDDPIVTLFQAANYRVEPAAEDPTGTVVIFFPIKSAARRSEKQVSVYEKANLAVLAQAWWSDNSVSVTLSFDKETENDDIINVLSMNEGHVKTLSFLPMGNATYPQMPYTQITAEEYEVHRRTLQPVDLDPIYDGDMDVIDAIGEAFCTTDSCEIKEIEQNQPV